MEARVRKSPMIRDWKEIYKAALFEDDNSKIPQRIAEAEKALAARASELFGGASDQVREQQAMENARYFLRVLGSTTETLNSAHESLSLKGSSSDRTKTGEALLVSLGRQDLHAAISSPPFCIE